MKRSKKCVLIIIASITFLLFLGSAMTYGVFFPVRYSKIIEDYEGDKIGDKYLYLSIIKAESGFRKNCISDAGACGLMQIIPSTAEFIASKNGIKSFDIFDERTNITFGIWYFNYLYKRFNSIKWAICAYNAGEGTVSMWIENGLTDIPYRETAEYLERVLKFNDIYNRLYTLCEH